jgi:hypothetical protein
MNQQFEIYTSSDGSTQIEVKFEGETFWLSLNQISSLFEKDKSVISRHISNIYREGELERSSTVAKNTTVQYEADRQVKRDIEYYYFRWLSCELETRNPISPMGYKALERIFG